MLNLKDINWKKPGLFAAGVAFGTATVYRMIKKLEEISGEDKLTLNSRMEKNMEPIFFMVEYTGCMLIWSTRVVVPSHPTPAQEETLETLHFAAMLAPGYHREQVGPVYEECVRRAKELH